MEASFQQWGLEFIGEIHPASSTQHRSILKRMNYFTKWIEEFPSSKATSLIVIQFLENILSRFSSPKRIITDNG